MAPSEENPLHGLRILVTRSRSQAGELSARLAEMGAEPIEAPLIRIEAPTDWSALDRALSQLTTYDRLIFTSANSVDYFFQRCHDLKPPVDLPASMPIAVVGKATAARLRQHGLKADVQPDAYHAEALVDLLVKKKNIHKAHVLFPCSDIARQTVVDGLTAAGASVTAVAAYRTVVAETLPDEIMTLLRRKAIDVITFASSSTVQAFVQALGNDLHPTTGIAVACIGPVTRDAAIAAGLSVDIMPEETSIPALVDAIVRHHSPP